VDRASREAVGKSPGHAVAIVAFGPMWGRSGGWARRLLQSARRARPGGGPSARTANAKMHRRRSRDRYDVAKLSIAELGWPSAPMLRNRVVESIKSALAGRDN
jgi:hypothetical protein